MKVLVVGGGGREHALCWALARHDPDAPTVERLVAAPGNPGIGGVAENVPVPVEDLDGLARLARRERFDLVVVGPEAPLVAGLGDRLRDGGAAVLGPGADGARVEGSKAWARDLCARHGIPSPEAGAFDAVAPALDFLDRLGTPPFVVKADGLAGGKGVTIASDRDEAERAVRASLEDRVFGPAGATVVIEEHLTGPEVSALALVDGPHVEMLALAQDHKRIFDGDRGPNTGGMGAHSPLPFVDGDTERRIRRDVLEPAAAALAKEGVDYRGVLYAGLMLTTDGPRVLEFNCRFGDPETQVIMPRLASSLPLVLLACAEGRLATEPPLRWRPDACVGVVLASEGYPGPPTGGLPIGGLDEAAAVPGVQVFHSGTVAREGRVVTAGGRVLTVTALGPTSAEARTLAYEACSRVSFPGMQYRRDVARPRSQGAG